MKSQTVFFLSTLIFLFTGICLSAQDSAAPNLELTEADSEEFIQQDITVLTIQTDVPKARIYLNGQYKGISPLCIKSLVPGFYKLTLKKDGFEDTDTMIQAELNKIKAFEFNLKPINPLNP